MKTWSNWPTSAVVLCFAAAMLRCGSEDKSSAGAADYEGAAGAWGPYDEGVPSTTGSGGSAPTLEPEVESESSFRVPVATDHYVWTANPLSGMVALIDARDRSVRTVPAGFGPTYLAAVPTPEGSDESRAIVINVLSQDAHLLIARTSGEIDSYRVNGIHSGANSWAISPGGRWAIAWTNVAEVTNPDPIEGFQDISVVDLEAVGEDTVEATRLSVAFRPTRLFISDDETRAFAVTEPGITVIGLDGSSPRVIEDLPIAGATIDDPAARDVTVTPDGRFAVVRREGSADVHILSLDTDDAPVAVSLEGPVTDLDLSGDGSFAVAVVRSQSHVEVGTGGATGAGGAAGAPTAGGAGQLAGAAGVPGVSGSAGAPGSGGVVAAGGSPPQGGEAGTPDAGGSAGAAPTGGEGGAAPGGAAGMPVAAGAPGLAGAAGSSAGAPALAGAAGWPGGSPGVAGAAGWPGGSPGMAGAAGVPGGAFGAAGAAGWLSAGGAAGSAGSAGTAGAPDVGIGGQVSTGGSTGAGGLASGGDTGAGGTSSGGVGVGGGTGGLLTGGTGGLLTGGTGGLFGVGGGSGGAPPVTYAWGPSFVYVLNIAQIFADPDSFDPLDREQLDDEIVGSVSLSELGTQALLFTTADAPPEKPQANQHLTVLDLTGERDRRTEHLRAAVHAVFVSPDDEHAIVLLTPGPASTMAGAFSVVPVIESLPPRIQGTTAPPVGVALAASPANMGLVTVSDPLNEIYETYLVQLPGLQVDAFELARRPLATGIVPSVAAGYVAQEHPDGRITFITFDTNDRPIDYTLTGFELGATTGR